MAKAIADLQEPILKVGSAPKTYSLYIGIPFCPSRCSYCSFVSCNLDRDRKLVQPYVDCLCKEVEAIRDEADKAGLKLCSIYIGGGSPPPASRQRSCASSLGTVRDCFDLSAIVEYTVEAGRPDCTDAEKLAVIREYGATRISINPQTFSDEVLANIGRQALGSGHPRLLCRRPGPQARRHQHGPHRWPARRHSGRVRKEPASGHRPRP